MLSHERDLYVIRENTLLIVVFSTVVFGSMMPLFAKLLGIKVEKQSIDTQVFNRFRNLSIASLDELLIEENKLSFEELHPLEVGHANTVQYIRSMDLIPKVRGPVHNAWKNFDDKYLKKYLGGY